MNIRLGLAAIAIGILACDTRASRIADSLTVTIAPSDEVVRFRAAADRRLDELTVRISEAKASVLKKAGAARDSAEKEAADLEITARVLRDRLRNAKYESKEAWDGFTADVDRALEGLSARLDRLFK